MTSGIEHSPLETCDYLGFCSRCEKALPQPEAWRYTGVAFQDAMISSMTQRPPAYLDWNASAPLAAPAREALQVALTEPGNPSSVHGAGRRARALLDTARAKIAAALGGAPEQLIFTGGGSEANALALGLAGDMPILVSATEHDSVLANAPGAQAIPVLRSGLIDMDALAAMLDRPAFVCVMAANNETGVIQPIDEVAMLVRATGGLLHVDAAQAFGKIGISGCPADSISLSAHKMGGPKGVGALLVRGNVPPRPQTRGGGQEFGWRAGTQNVPGIAAFAAALDQPAWQEEAARLRDLLEARISAVEPRACLIAGDMPRLPNTSCLWMPGLEAATQVMRFDLAGFEVSAGSACSSGKVKQSHVLAAMGFAPDVCGQSIRISIGWESRETQLLAFADEWIRIYAERTRRAA
jgi:cysteine desulfurase